ncbi:type II secretion system protein GspD [Undibacterium terreum]|uniref:Type II secretion system protein GspD n=2 Tax=Undibacterium terreum TaxID=1224302 RepID=A0A916UTU3_9BURK|nr:type II secretion system protein GspD [Undibacterium terreum]
MRTLPSTPVALSVIATLITLAVSGCAEYDPLLNLTKAPKLPTPLQVQAQPSDGTITDSADNSAAPEGRPVFRKTPRPPAQEEGKVTKPQELPANEKADISLVFDQIPLPAFINTVYGAVLKTNFSVDPRVLERKDLVTLRTSRAQTPTEVLRAAQLLLKSYGVTVNDIGGFYRIVPDNAQLGYSPEIRRGRALPEVPMALRPIYQYVEMNALRSAEMRAWLAQMFGNRLQLIESAQYNALMVSGETEDVKAALEVIRVMDQPTMRGRTSQRINPVYWTVDDLARKLNELLAAEGYTSQVGMGAGAASTPIILLPIAANNSLIVFAGDDAILKHVADWVRDLDQPTKARGGNGYFTYAVQNLDADDLAKTVQDLLGGATVAATPGAVASTKPAARVVVHKPTNTLIIQGTADQYSQWIGLLRELDKPARSALIEMTVAEVTLTDSLNLGVEWALNNGSSSAHVIGGTLGNLGLATGGLSFSLVNGNVKAALNALAGNKRAQILSSPRIMARNGETATISVGQQVPILTSQQTTGTTIPGVPGVTQTIQYKDTGIILKVKPVIHAGGRIDVDVSQEVSSAGTTTTGVSSSPTFSNRKIDTKLSIQDGATVLLAGLISGNNTRNNNGVPLAKDIPILGALFRNQADTNDKTELIVLITPYIVEDDQTAQSITQAFRNQLGNWAAAPPNPANSPIAPSKRVPLGMQSGKKETDNTEMSDDYPSDIDAGRTVNQSDTHGSVGSKEAASEKPIKAEQNQGQVVTDPKIIEEIRALQRGVKK